MPDAGYCRAVQAREVGIASVNYILMLNETPHRYPTGIQILSGRAWSATGNESCIVSRDAGMKRTQGLPKVCIEPRNQLIAGASIVSISWGHAKPTLGKRPSWGGPAGVLDHIKGRRGYHGNTGEPRVSESTMVRVTIQQQSRLPGSISSP